MKFGFLVVLTLLAGTAVAQIQPTGGGVNQNRVNQNRVNQNGVQGNGRLGTTGAANSAQMPNTARSLGGQVPLPNVGNNPNQVLPRPFPELTPAHVQYLNQLLTYWETNSNKIKRYQCKFTNWTYNSMQVPIRDPKSNHFFAQTISVGTVKFAAPDKGLFDSEKVWAFDKERFANKQDPFKESAELRDKWHCDGKAVYQYHFNRKELIETPIPPEMQGERIVDGPLPFLFGAKADELKKRYWIRVITPKERGEKGEYWLEAYPKYRRDASSFQKVEIILEKTDFLPAVLTMFAPEHDLVNGRTIVKQTIKFESRKIWETEKAGGIAGLFDDLPRRPSTPFGWRRTVNELKDTQRISQNPNGANPQK